MLPRLPLERCHDRALAGCHEGGRLDGPVLLVIVIVIRHRILAYYGLQKVNTNPNNGIRALIQLSGQTRALKMINLVFMILFVFVLGK